MEPTQIIELIDIALWPSVAIFVIALFQTPIKRLLFNIREFEGAGVAAKFDPNRGAEIIKQGRQEDLSDREIADRVFKEAVFDEREFRILRALFGETNGRHLHSYQRSTYYRSTLKTLVHKNWIHPSAEGYRLTPSGKEIIGQKLKALLES